MREEHRQFSCGEHVLGCAAEDHLPQAALCVGTLDQQVCALRPGLPKNDLTRALSVSVDCLLGCSDAMSFQVPERVLGGWTRDKSTNFAVGGNG